MIDLNFKISPLLLLLLLSCLTSISCFEHFHSFETDSESVDDGQHKITQLSQRSFNAPPNSIGFRQPTVERKVIIEPSSISDERPFNSRITSQQVKSNKVGVGLDSTMKGGRFLWPDFFSFRTRGFFSKARTVESPALSVDTGGQSSGGFAKQLNKLFDVKQGFYSDIYSQMDGQIKLTSTTTTRRPEQASSRNAIRYALERAILD